MEFDVMNILMDIAVILLATKLLGMLTRKLGLPQVVGMILAGLLIGPAIFSKLNLGGFQGLIHPTEAEMDVLQSFSQVGVVFILLLATPLGIAGDTGNKAWLEFPFLPVKGQPAEIVKLTFIIVLAKQLSWLKENRDLRSISSIVMLAAHFGVIFALYYKISSDMGSALVFLFIFACMCFVAGVALRWFLIGGGAAGLLFYAMWDLDLLDTYMKNRFIVLFDHSYDPLNTGWQQTRSLLTLGGGRIFGQGLFRGTQTQSEAASSLPHRHTDFIFSVIGEELGLVGCLLTLALLTAIILRCLYVARHAKTRLEGYACIGVASVIIFQVIINVGMCLFVMPVIGLTLPFISYGGSSLVMLFACMGLVSGVYGRAKPDWLR